MAENWAIHHPNAQSLPLPDIYLFHFFFCTLNSGPWICCCCWLVFNKFHGQNGPGHGHDKADDCWVLAGSVLAVSWQCPGLCYCPPGSICMPHLRTSSSSFIYFIAASFALWTQWPVDIILIIALSPSPPEAWGSWPVPPSSCRLFSCRFITRIPLIFMDFS